ncbi:MAG: dehydrogenase [Vulcanococcus sp.]|jgi:hypothetical protein
MRFPRRRTLLLASLAAASLALAADAQAPAPAPGAADALTGPRGRLGRDWIGVRQVASTTPILVMAGHADSQAIPGSGTSGYSVDIRGAKPMQQGIRDELYWNLEVARRVVQLGRQRGLNIRFYDPPARTILDGDDPRTNWSVGKAHAEAGGYAVEIHFDAYGPDGIGSGVIPALHRPLSSLDESLAVAFGGYPLRFRGGLGGPKRGITLLEIGKLEAPLEPALRNPRSRDQALAVISERVVAALEAGLGRHRLVVAPPPVSAHGAVGLAATNQ